MSIPQSVAEVLRGHVTLEIEGIDRCTNVYIPQLQREGGVAGFFRFHRGYPFASSALMDPISKGFVAEMEGFSDREGVPVVLFRKGQRKDDIAAEHLKRFTKPEGVLFIGKAQEKTLVFRTERRRNAQTGVSYPWLISRSSAAARSGSGVGEACSADAMRPAVPPSSIKSPQKRRNEGRTPPL